MEFLHFKLKLKNTKYSDFIYYITRNKIFPLMNSMEGHSHTKLILLEIAQS